MRVREWLAVPIVKEDNTTERGSALRVRFATMSREGLHVDMPRKGSQESGATVRVLALDAAKEWELAYIAEMEQLAEEAPSNLKLTYWSVRSRDDGIDESQTGDFGLVGVSFGLIIVFVSLVNSSKNAIETRTWVALAGAGCAALSIPAGFGIAAAAGAEMASTVGLTPFLLIGVGVDDMFIFSSAVQRTPQEWSVSRRMGKSTKDAALAVTVTTVTNVVAFGIGATSPFRAIISFCIYTICCVIVVYLLMCTLLVACIALDLRREANGRSALTCRVRQTTVSDAEDLKPVDANPMWSPVAKPSSSSSRKERPVSPRRSSSSFESLRSVPIPSATLSAAIDDGRGADEEAGTSVQRERERKDGHPKPRRMSALALVSSSQRHVADDSQPPVFPVSPASPGGAKKKRRRSSGLPRREEIQVHGYVGAKLDRLFARKLGPCIVFPPTLLVVAVVYVVFIAVSLYGLANLKQGLDLTKMSPDGHHSNDYEKEDSNFFRDAGRLYDIVVTGPVYYRIAKLRDAVNTVPGDAVDRTEYLLLREKTWLDSFESFREAHSSQPPRDMSPAEFRVVFADWLESAAGSGFGPGLSLVDETRGEQLPRFNHSRAVQRLRDGAEITIQACLLPMVAFSSKESRDDARAMQAARKAVTDSRAAVQRRFEVDLPDMFPWSEWFLIFAQYIMIPQSTAMSLAFAAVAILIVALVMLPSPIMVGTMLLGIVGIDLLIVGGMWILDIPLDAISSGTLTISIGFSIDFVAHIGHAFLHANGEGFQTNNKCTLPALPSPEEEEEEEAAEDDHYLYGEGMTAIVVAGLGKSTRNKGPGSPSGSSAARQHFVEHDAEIPSALSDNSRPRSMNPAPVEFQGVEKRCFGPSRQARVVEALTLLGRPVFQGGVSTMLGIIPLAFTQSHVFHVFFAMLFMTILFGLTHGILIIPMYLRTWGPPRLLPPAGAKEREVIKMKQPRSKRRSIWNRNDVLGDVSSGPTTDNMAFQSVTNPLRREGRKRLGQRHS